MPQRKFKVMLVRRIIATFEIRAHLKSEAIVLANHKMDDLIFAQFPEQDRRCRMTISESDRGEDTPVATEIS